MTPEKRIPKIDPKSIRAVPLDARNLFRNDSFPVTHYGRSNLFNLYRCMYTEDSTESTIPGPDFNYEEDLFVDNNKGLWKKLRLKSAEVIKYFLSPKVKVMSISENYNYVQTMEKLHRALDNIGK